MTLELSKAVRQKLKNRERASIIGEGECPVRAGDEVPVVAGLTLVVERVNVRKGGGWSLRYTLMDRRDPVRNLKRLPRVQDFDEIRKSFDEFGFPQDPTPDVLKQAGLESAYTSMPTTLADAGEAIDPDVVDEVNKRRLEHRGLWQREKQQIVASLQRLAEDPDTSLVAAREIRALQRQLDALERKLKGAA